HYEKQNTPCEGILHGFSRVSNSRWCVPPEQQFSLFDFPNVSSKHRAELIGRAAFGMLIFRYPSATTKIPTEIATFLQQPWPAGRSPTKPIGFPTQESFGPPPRRTRQPGIPHMTGKKGLAKPYFRSSLSLGCGFH